MPKLRKMLGRLDSPYVVSLMGLIEIKDKATIAAWCMDYAQANILTIYEKRRPGDLRPRRGIEAARQWFAGEVKLPQAKRIILDECHQAAREAEGDPAAQAAARACGQAASCFHVPSHSLGLVLYGTAAIAYDRVGLDQGPEVYERIAAEECGKMEAALGAMAVEDEPNPAGMAWKR